MDLLKSINGPQFKNRCSASSFLHYAYFVYYGLSFLLTLTKTEQLEPGQGYISSSNSISGPKLKGFLGICLLFIKCIQLHIFVMCYLAMLQQVRLYNVQGWLVKSKMYRIWKRQPSTNFRWHHFFGFEENHKKCSLRISILIRSNETQQYADVYLLQNYSTCFGNLSHSSSGVHKTVTAASGTGHITCQSNNLPPAWPNGCDRHPKHVQ